MRAGRRRAAPTDVVARPEVALPWDDPFEKIVVRWPPPKRRSGPGLRSGQRRGVLAPFAALIARVPRGRVVTYGDVARLVGRPGAARLTVRALRLFEELPWHRVVAAGGRIALRGDEAAEQRLRLETEGVTFRRGAVRLDRHRWAPSRTARAFARRGSARSRAESQGGG